VATSRSAGAALLEDGWRDFAEIELLHDDGGRARRALAEQVLLPRFAARSRADVIHSLASTAPARPRVPSVVTLHDVTFFQHKTFSPVTTFGLRRTVTAGARGAAGFIAASEAARDEICAVLGLDPAAFTVVPHGPGRTAGVAPAPAHAVRELYALGDNRVLLSVGAKRPHKNQEVLVRAAGSLPADVVLVLAGHPEPYDQELRGIARELGVTGRIRFVDYVGDDELEALWRLSAASAQPTLAEGFGLPVLEAMAHGVATACSDIAVLREVGGDVPYYFDPHDSLSATAAIEAALSDPGAGGRGRERAALFTWKRAAEQTFVAYERALSARS
jgi:glycosyltransferase involved in cell wall biosynthesis